MANYFLDASALRSCFTRRPAPITSIESSNRPLPDRCSRLSIIEFESVLAIKTRTGEIDEAALQIARRRFRADLARRRLIVAPPVHEVHFQAARKLLVQYGAAEGLRTLDALQLAIALDLHRQGHIGILVAADQKLCRVAPLAGCTAINPEQPGPILV